MHIPDGLIPLNQALLYGLIVIIIILADFLIETKIGTIKNLFDERNIPLVAVLAAGIFAIQFFNFPIIGGTTGHVIGAVLVAILLGSPFAGILVLTLVLILQAFAFGDGGITALGVNILNMAIIGSITGFLTYKGLRGINEFAAIVLAGWVSVFLASIAAAFELYVAGVFPLVAGITLMGSYHAVIGAVEGIITAFAVSAIRTLRPDLVSGGMGTHE